MSHPAAPTSKPVPATTGRPVPRPPGGRPRRMPRGAITPERLADLAVRAEVVAANELKPNTRRAYDVTWRAWSEFCADNAVTELPAEASTVVVWLQALLAADYKPGSIERMLSTVSRRHREIGADPNPCNHPEVKRWLAGMRNTAAGAGVTQTKAPAITPEQLAVIVSRIDVTTHRGRRDKALLLVGFAGLFRGSELAGLRCSDVVDRQADTIVIRLRDSKTHNANEADDDTATIAAGRDPQLCPVTALTVWHEHACGCDWTTDNWLFRGMRGQGDTIGTKPIDSRVVTDVLAARAATAGLTGKWTSHSLRRGGATTMATRGASVFQIEKAGRWRRGSRMPARYVEGADAADAARLLVL